MVLSKFWILTVFSVISCTIPFAFEPGTVIQSPGRSISLAESCMPATNPKIVSLNTNIRIAAEAPNPANRLAGDFPIKMAIMTIPPIKNSKTWSTCMNPLIGRFLFPCRMLYISRNTKIKPFIANNKANTIYTAHIFWDKSNKPFPRINARGNKA